MNDYIGHPSQLFGIEEHRLCGGKGDGMRILEVNNGNGLMFCVSADRCGDISRVYYKGTNLGFFSPCGYVSPKYYDNKGDGFLKSFTAGFFTTCGLTAVGSPCTDEGEELPLHGSISNTPAENINYYADDDKLYISLTVRDAALFAHKLVLNRSYECSTKKNEIIIHDRVKNIGSEETPYMILYHFNMGYPLLTQNAIIKLPYNKIEPRNARAAEGIDKAMIMEKPQTGFVEQCYYYSMNEGKAEIYNPDLKLGLSINYNTNELPFFTEWKMMGKGEYVLGLEPGNCNPDGRDVMREKGLLKILKSGEEVAQTIVLRFN